MSPRNLYRTAAVLLVVFAILHTIGFAQVDPAWGIDKLISEVRASTFTALGQQRTFWDFYLGLGYSVTVWLLVAALTAWELGRTTAPLPLIRWGLVGAMLATAALSWRYIFPPPLVNSLLIAVILAWAAVRASGRPDRP